MLGMQSDSPRAGGKEMRQIEDLDLSFRSGGPCLSPCLSSRVGSRSRLRREVHLSRRCIGKAIEQPDARCDIAISPVRRQESPRSGLSSHTGQPRAYCAARRCKEALHVLQRC